MSWLLSPDDAAEVETRIAAALDDFRTRAARHDDGAGELADAAARAAAGGKRLRPALVHGVFAAFGGHEARRPAMLDIAAATELLHAAFVVHDDVIDHDTVRRGVPNVAGEFALAARSRGADANEAADAGTAAAVLAGDLLLHEAERLVGLAELPVHVRGGILGLLDEAVLVSVAGELADALPDADDDPLRTAHDKTAVYSFVLPMCAGALLADAAAADQDALRRCGSALGLAFQLVDDLIGTFGSAAQAGRPAGADLREGKRTPLVVLAGDGGEDHEIQGALALARTGPVGVRAAQHALESAGARRRLVTIVSEQLRIARAAAESLPEPARAVVDGIALRIEGRLP